MPSILHEKLTLAILIPGLLLSGCQRTATAPGNPSASQTDLDFVTGLTNLREFNHRVIGRELQRASNPHVGTLAQDLLARIDDFYGKVEPVAARDGIKPPTDMSLFEQSDMQSRVAALMATSKYDFDKEFLSDELAGNQETLRNAQQVVGEPSGNSELRTLLLEAIPRLKDDINRLERLQAELAG